MGRGRGKYTRLERAVKQEEWEEGVLAGWEDYVCMHCAWRLREG